MLNLRGVYISQSDRAHGDSRRTHAHPSDLRFASQIVGNLGAPLHIGSSETSTSGSSRRGGGTTIGSDTVVAMSVDDEPKQDEVIEISNDPLSAGLVRRSLDDLELSTFNEDQQAV